MQIASVRESIYLKAAGIYTSLILPFISLVSRFQNSSSVTAARS